jgi:hypothetical protein
MTSTLYPQLVLLLRASGCVFVRQGKGSYEIWRSPINQKTLSLFSDISVRAIVGGALAPIEASIGAKAPPTTPGTA